MRLAELPVPKKKPITDRGDGLDEPFFSCIYQRTEEILRRFPVGKVALLCDGEGYAFLSDLVRNQRVIALVHTAQDALPLFSLPETAVCAIGVGGEAIMKVARYFSTVRRIPCFLFPTDGRFLGVFEGMGELFVNGEKSRYPLQRATVWCDRTIVKGTASAFARNLLARLVLFERRALRLLRGAGTEHCERLYSVVGQGGGESAEEVLSISCRRAQSEIAGEGWVLADMLPPSDFPEWQAYRALLALYAAFLQKGKRNPLAVPDYLARCERAKTGVEGYRVQHIPTVDELNGWEVAFSQTRATLLLEIQPILHAFARDRRTFALLGGREASLPFSILYTLPERAPEGLCAVMRDFGLFE